MKVFHSVIVGAMLMGCNAETDSERSKEHVLDSALSQKSKDNAPIFFGFHIGEPKSAAENTLSLLKSVKLLYNDTTLTFPLQDSTVTFTGKRITGADSTTGLNNAIIDLNYESDSLSRITLFLPKGYDHKTNMRHLENEYGRLIFSEKTHDTDSTFYWLRDSVVVSYLKGVQFGLITLERYPQRKI